MMPQECGRGLLDEGDATGCPQGGQRPSDAGGGTKRSNRGATRALERRG